MRSVTDMLKRRGGGGGIEIERDHEVNIYCVKLLEPKVLEDSVSSISRKFCYTHI